MAHPHRRLTSKLVTVPRSRTPRRDKRETHQKISRRRRVAIGKSARTQMGPSFAAGERHRVRIRCSSQHLEPSQGFANAQSRSHACDGITRGSIRALQVNRTTPTPRFHMASKSLCDIEFPCADSQGNPARFHRASFVIVASKNKKFGVCKFFATSDINTTER